MPEIGLDGLARVVQIQPCPTIEPDDGTGRMVVTGTMAHLAGNILEIDVAGLNEPLGVTTTHPMWSEDRHEFVVAGELAEGEQLRLITGQSATITNIIDRNGPQEFVYNLEIDGEHVYHVADVGVLAHNSCMTGDQIALKDLVKEASGGARYLQTLRILSLIGRPKLIIPDGGHLQQTLQAAIGLAVRTFTFQASRITFPFYPE